MQAHRMDKPFDFSSLDSDRLRRKLESVQAKLEYAFYQLDGEMTTPARTLLDTRVASLERTESCLLSELRSRGLWMRTDLTDRETKLKRKAERMR